MIEAVIYDMDGVIIDSEPFWREAIIYTFNTVGLTFTDDMCRITQGMRLIEVIEYWFDKIPWQGKSITKVEEIILNKVSELIIEKGKVITGVKESIQYFKSKNYKIALASSSSNILINTVLNKLSLKNYFEVVNSAEHLNYGKPHPEIFIKTAQQLNIKPINCLVIEDSFYGILAAKAATMKVIAIPEKVNYNNPKFSIADYNIKSLNEIPNLNF